MSGPLLSSSHLLAHLILETALGGKNYDLAHLHHEEMVADAVSPARASPVRGRTAM